MGLVEAARRAGLYPATKIIIMIIVMPLFAETTRAETVRYNDEVYVPYATVQRTDGSYRRMLTTQSVLESVARSGETPDGARILMETYYRPGQRSTVFHKQKQRGRWFYGSFNEVVDLSVRPQASCLSCHTRAAESDFTFTQMILVDVARGAEPFVTTCDRPGRQPCPPSTYTR